MKKEEVKSKELIVPKSEVPALPDYLQGKTGTMQNIKPEDLSLGFIKIMQFLSPEVKNRLFEAGRLINGGTMEDYGMELSFIPILDLKQAIKWCNREESGSGKVDCISSDAVVGSKYGSCNSCEFNYNKWKESDDTQRKSLCSLYLNFPSLVNNDTNMPVLVSFVKTNYFTGLKLAKLYMALCAKANSMLPLYSFKFKLISSLKKNNKGEYYSLDIVPNGYATKEEFAKAEHWHQVLAKSTYKVDFESAHTKTEDTPF